MLVASLRAAGGAVSFLTRIPVGRFVDLGSSDVARGSVLFPLVGAGVGALTGGAAALLHPALPAFLSAGVAVGVAALVTGAMHLDALADTFDATGAGTRAEALAVMRDPRLGTFGVTALALDLFLKVGSIAFLLDRGGALSALVAAGALSRGSGVSLAALLPYARLERGPGSVLSDHTPVPVAAVAALIAVLASVGVAGIDGIWFATAALGSTLVSGILFRSWLGGTTGDALGAATEVCEVVVLVVAAGLA